MKKFDKLEKFINILFEHERQNPEELYPPTIDAQFALDCLTEAFLGSDYYIVLPCCNEQANTIILDEILRTYSKDYRKLIKKSKRSKYEK